MDALVLEPILVCKAWTALFISVGFVLGVLTCIAFLRRKESDEICSEQLLFWTKRIGDITGNPEIGVIFARGSDLRIFRMNHTLRKLLGFPEGSTPETVHNLLPASLRGAHQAWLKSAVSKKQLPGNLIHPLRGRNTTCNADRAQFHGDFLFQLELTRRSWSAGNVEMIGHRGKKLTANVSIGILRKEDKVSDSCLFYAMVSPVSPAEGKNVMEEKNWRGAMAHMYGVNVGHVVANGNLPPPESYHTATVLFLDICNFTRSCMARNASDVAVWMRKVHHEVEAALQRHHIRKIETRGDCYVCVTGTNAMPKDMHHNQVVRMLQFAQDASNTLRTLFATEIRVGISTGPVTISFIETHQYAPTMCVFGDTVCTAARMEQTGAPAHVHLCQAASERYAEETHESCPPLHRMEVKSKGLVPTSFFCCQRSRFLRDGEKAGSVVLRSEEARRNSAGAGALLSSVIASGRAMAHRRRSCTDCS